jgi:hypothetical protein
VQVVKSVDARNYDLTVFKVKWGNLTLKIYDMGGRVLRIEVVAHNVKDLRSGKVLDLLKRMREMLVRFLVRCKQRTLRFWTKAPLSGGASQRNEVLGDWRALISIKLATVMWWMRGKFDS